MFKKIALLGLFSAPLLCTETPKQDATSATIIDSLKKLHEKVDLITKKQESATDMLYAKLARNQNETSALHIKTSEILLRKLPKLPRTKIFVAGSLVGFGACLYLEKNNPELFQYPHIVIDHFEKAYDTTRSKPKATLIHAQPSDDNIAPDESGAEAAAEEQAAKDSNSCYFR